MKWVLALVLLVFVAIGCNQANDKVSDSISVMPESESVEGHQVSCVTIEEADSLTVYYPNFSRIDLVTGTMPDKLADRIGIP